MSTNGGQQSAVSGQQKRAFGLEVCYICYTLITNIRRMEFPLIFEIMHPFGPKITSLIIIEECSVYTKPWTIFHRFSCDILYRCRPYGALAMGRTVSIQIPPLRGCSYWKLMRCFFYELGLRRNSQKISKGLNIVHQTNLW